MCHFLSLTAFQQSHLSVRFIYPSATSCYSVDLSFRLQTLQRAQEKKRQEQSHKEQYASGSVDYVKTEGEACPVPQLYMDCKIKVSLNIQHAVQ